jgi:methylmalonyl-CoA mutase N-terminal domain/subunit
VSAEVEEKQLVRLAAFKKSRDAGAVTGALAALQDAAAGSANTMPCILAAVEARATLGEVADSLRQVFGEYQESVVV